MRMMPFPPWAARRDHAAEGEGRPRDSDLMSLQVSRREFADDHDDRSYPSGVNRATKPAVPICRDPRLFAMATKGRCPDRPVRTGALISGRPNSDEPVRARSSLAQRRRAVRFFAVFAVFFLPAAPFRAVFLAARLAPPWPRPAALVPRFFAAFFAFRRLRAAAFFPALRLGAGRRTAGMGAGPPDAGAAAAAGAAGSGFSGVLITDPPIALGSVE
jgi:hypothetical protein